jgi:hypothetical protein
MSPPAHPPAAAARPRDPTTVSSPLLSLVVKVALARTLARDRMGVIVLRETRGLQSPTLAYEISELELYDVPRLGSRFNRR